MSTATASSGRSVGRHALAAAERRRRYWAAGWRSALRLAWRDALAHRAATALILAMVGLPVLLVTGGATYLATTDVSAAESVPAALGQAQAKLTDASAPAQQNADATSWTTAGDASEERAVPGHRPGTAWTAAQLATLTGGTVVPVGYPSLLADVGGQPHRVTALAGDLDGMPASGLGRLESGRWPSEDDEIAVTPAGVEVGLPTSGTVELQGDQHRTVRVVGMIRAVDARFGPVQLIGGRTWLSDDPTLPPDEQTAFLVLRSAPVSWAEVQRLNAYGLLVLSRAVLADPPIVPDLDQTSGDQYAWTVTVLLCAALILETTLLAGPAFAVSAARRRRSLALLAGNGADRGQLIRYVGAQGLVLGGLGAVVGLGLGLVGGAVAARVLPAVIGGSAGPFDTMLGLVLPLTGAAVLAAVVAAGVPARGAAGLALQGRVSGRAGSAREPSPVLVCVGLTAVVLGVAGGALAYAGMSESAQLLALGVAAGVLILGVVCLLPGLLFGLGRVARLTPLALRLSLRDLARERSRSVPAVASIVVAVAVLTVLASSIGSDDAQGERDHSPIAVPGQGVVWVGGPSRRASQQAQEVLAEIRLLHPDWRVEGRGALGDLEYREGSGTGTVVAAVPSGCTAVQAIAPIDDGPTRCTAAGSNGDRPLQVAGASTLQSYVTPTSAEREVLAAGGLLVTRPGLVRDGAIRVAVGTYVRPSGGDRKVTRTLRLPALVVPSGRLGALLGLDPHNAEEPGAVLQLDRATAERLPVHLEQYDVADPAGPISRSAEREINAATDNGETTLAVERGYESPSRTVLLVIAAVAVGLVVFATLIATALTYVERRAELTTVASVGATPAFRRRLTGTHAYLLAGLGALLGVLAGLLPGALFALALTTEASTADGLPPRPPVLAVPWPILAVVLAGVPLLAAALATLLVRPAPVLTRRLG